MKKHYKAIDFAIAALASVADGDEDKGYDQLVKAAQQSDLSEALEELNEEQARLVEVAAKARRKTTSRGKAGSDKSKSKKAGGKKGGSYSANHDADRLTKAQLAKVIKSCSGEDCAPEDLKTSDLRAVVIKLNLAEDGDAILKTRKSMLDLIEQNLDAGKETASFKFADADVADSKMQEIALASVSKMTVSMRSAMLKDAVETAGLDTDMVSDTDMECANDVVSSLISETASVEESASLLVRYGLVSEEEVASLNEDDEEEVASTEARASHHTYDEDDEDDSDSDSDEDEDEEDDDEEEEDDEGDDEDEGDDDDEEIASIANLMRQRHSRGLKNLSGTR